MSESKKKNGVKKKLSNSSCARYLTCPASWDYYYNQNIRPIKVGSALVFGSAMDAALNGLLLGNEKPSDAFKRVWAEYDPETIEYSKYDLDTDLGDTPEASLYQKAKLLVEAYKRDVLPNIERVLEVQTPAGPGYLDALVEWKGRGVVLLDHKTSSRPYADNAANYSAQLAMYSAEKQVSQVAFIVLIKQIKKNRIKLCATCGHLATGTHKTCNFIVEPQTGKPFRCGNEWTETISPEGQIQIIHGNIEQRAMELAAELQANVQKAVDAKLFHCSVTNCNSIYGKPCEYKNLKWFGSMDGLKKVDKK